MSSPREYTSPHQKLMKFFFMFSCMHGEVLTCAANVRLRLDFWTASVNVRQPADVCIGSPQTEDPITGNGTWCGGMKDSRVLMIVIKDVDICSLA